MGSIPFEIEPIADEQGNQIQAAGHFISRKKVIDATGFANTDDKQKEPFKKTWNKGTK
jgi:hypothetical protein